MTSALPRGSIANAMAVIEKITLKNTENALTGDELGTAGLHPGLRINIRGTTASHSDYALLNLDEVLSSPLDLIITDGVCS